MLNKIKEIWALQWKNILIVITYIIIASLVYGVWFNSLWGLWYVNLLTIIAIIASGCTIGYFYIKSEMKKNASEEKKDNVEESK